jgi:hypothetical protein
MPPLSASPHAYGSAEILALLYESAQYKELFQYRIVCDFKVVDLQRRIDKFGGFHVFEPSFI